MSLKMKFTSKLIVTQNGKVRLGLFALGNLEYILFLQKWNVTQNGMLLKMKYHSKWKVAKKLTVTQMECHSNWNIVKKGLSLKIKFY